MKICPGFEEIDLPNKIYCPKCESDANTDIRLIFVEGIQEPQWQVYCKKANMKHTNTPNTKTQLFDIVINIAGVYPGDDGQKYASIHILRGDFEGTSIEDFVNHVNDFSKLCTPVVEV